MVFEQWYWYHMRRKKEGEKLLAEVHNCIIIGNATHIRSIGLIQLCQAFFYAERDIFPYLQISICPVEGQFNSFVGIFWFNSLTF